MGKLLDIVRARLNAIRQELGQPQPDPKTDPKGAFEAIQRRNALRYIEAQINMQMAQALKNLSQERQNEFYDRCVQEDAKASFSREQFRAELDTANPDGKFLTRDDNFGQNWEQTIGTLEEMLGEEAANLAADTAEKTVAPDDPAFPAESRLRYPYQGIIGDIKQKVPENLPESQETKDFLDQVNQHLASPSVEMSLYVDGQDLDIQHASEQIQHNSSYQYMNREPVQKFYSKIPTTTYRSFDFPVPAPEALPRNPLLPDEIAEMKNIHPLISDETMQEINRIAGLLDELGEESYRNLYSARGPLPGTNETLFTSEQGVKNYAFWPLVFRREELEKAVESGDIEDIRTKDANYLKVKETTDKMMDIVRKNPSPICYANVNSTRLDNQFNPSPIPLEYQQDFITHSKLNGVYLIYALSKNTGKSVEELLKNPVQTMTDASDSYIKKYGLGTKTSNTDKLIAALDQNLSGGFNRNWDACYSMLANRAFGSAASMARTEEERIQIVGAGNLAVAAGSGPVKVQAELWDSLSSGEPEKKAVLTQHALLLDDDAFDPLDVAKKLKTNSWRKDTDPAALADQLKKEGKLNVSRLVQRIDEMREKARETKKYNSDHDLLPFRFGPAEIGQAAMELGKQILRTATGAEKNSEDYIALQEKVDKLSIEDHKEELEELEQQLRDNLDIQAQKKKGLFLSSKNSEEHQYMTLSQQMVLWKLKMLRGDDMSDVSAEMKELLRKSSLATLVNNSRDYTFDYCAKKTDYGSKTSFVYDTGIDRYNGARDSINALDDISELVQTKTAAHRYMDELRLDVLDNRANPEWVNTNALNHVARAMYAMTVDFKHPNDPNQKTKYMNEDKIRRHADTFKNRNNTVKRMIKKYGEDKLMEFMVKGKGSLTSAFVTAKNEQTKANNRKPGAERKEIGPEYKEMTVEQRREVWAKMGPM